MKGEVVSETVLTLLLVGMLILAFDFKPAGAEVLFSDDFETGEMVGVSEVNLIRDGQFLGESNYWFGIQNTVKYVAVQSARRVGYDGLPAPALEANVSGGYKRIYQSVDVPDRLESLVLTFYAKMVNGSGSIMVGGLGIEPVFVPDGNWRKYSVDFLNTSGPLWYGEVSFNFSNPQSSESIFLIDDVILFARAKPNTCFVRVNFVFIDPKGDPVYAIDARIGWDRLSGFEHDLGMDLRQHRNSVASLYLANGTYGFVFNWEGAKNGDVKLASAYVYAQPGNPDTFVFEVPLYSLTVTVTGIGNSDPPQYTQRIAGASGGTIYYYPEDAVTLAPGDYAVKILWDDFLGNEHEKEIEFTMDSHKTLHIQLDAARVGSLFLTSFQLAVLQLGIALIVIAVAITIIYAFWRRTRAKG